MMVTAGAAGGDGYVSAVQRRIVRDDRRLTVEFLSYHVPVLQAGEAADKRLNEPGLGKKEKRELRAAVEAAAESREELVLAGIPLVRALAGKELRRRQNWATLVTFEELFQEGVIGYLRGLSALDLRQLNQSQSPTHYLGQWVFTEMRRGVERLDNDFGVSFEAVERFRRIRAIRARMTTELNREPTDQEIIAASEEQIRSGGAILGRVGALQKPRKPLAVADLDEERSFNARVGALPRMAVMDDDEYQPGAYREDVAKPLLTPDEYGHVDHLAPETETEGLLGALNTVMDMLRVPLLQRRIIAMRFGIPPYTEEHPNRSIAIALGVRQAEVADVLDAFTAEMSRPGSVFHHVCSLLSGDDLDTMGLGWLPRTLGDYGDVKEADRALPPPAVLCAPLKSAAVSVPEDRPEELAGGATVPYWCEFHRETFHGVYRAAAAAPPNRPCPRCGRDSRQMVNR